MNEEVDVKKECYQIISEIKAQLENLDWAYRGNPRRMQSSIEFANSSNELLKTKLYTLKVLARYELES